VKKARARERRKQFLWLAVVVGGYLAIATAYALVLPWGDMPDESAHFLYVDYLLQERSLPVFTSGGGNYEAHQPPVYYLAAAPVVGLVRAAGKGVAAQGRAARLLSVLAGAAVILLTYRIFRRAAPGRPELAELAAGVTAFLPSHLLVCAAAGNDALAEVFFCAVALALVAMAEREPGWRELLALGVGIGLAVLTKVSAIILLGVAPLGLIVASRYWDRDRWARNAARACAIVLGAALVCSAWWLLRNQHLYGDPLGAKRFVEIFTRDRPGPAYFAKFGRFVYPQVLALWTFKSSFAVFGAANRFLPGWVYAVWLGVWLVAAAGAARSGWRWVRERRAEGATVVAAVVLGAEMVLVVAAFLRFNAVFFQAQARYLGLAVAGWTGLLALGLVEWVPRGRALLVARVLTVVLAAAAVLALAHGGEHVRSAPVTLAWLWPPLGGGHF